MKAATPFSFLRRAIAFGGLLLLLLVLVAVVGPPVTPVDYTEATIAKHARARHVGSPKALLVGGSNVAFGVESATLEQVLCMPVVNLGLHAGLGFRYMTNEAIELMGPGDLVIVALEESNYIDPVKDHEVIYQMVDRYPHALAYVPWWDRPRVVAGILVLRLQSLWKKWTGRWSFTEEHPLYRASGFNDRGDMVAHLAIPKPDELEDDGLDGKSTVMSHQFAPLANRLEAHAQEQGATVVYTWPARATSGYDPVRSKAIHDALTAQGRTLLGMAAENVYPDSMMHDTRYHLRADGRADRTARLSQQLCDRFPDRCCVRPAP